MRWPFRPWHYRIWLGRDSVRGERRDSGPFLFDHTWTIEFVGIVFALGVGVGMVIVWVLK